MLAHDQHQSFKDPPGHAMFRRENKGAKKGQDNPAGDSVISGMLSIMNSLCSGITPNQTAKWTQIAAQERRSIHWEVWRTKKGSNRLNGTTKIE